MATFNALWLRGQAAQTSMLQLGAYGAVFMGTASLQAMRLGLTAPQTFWGAMARATSPGVALPTAKRPKASKKAKAA